MNTSILLEALGVGFAVYSAFTLVFNRAGSNDDHRDDPDTLPENAIVPIYREVSLGRPTPVQRFLVFNLNTALLLVILVMVAVMMEWISEKAVMHVRVEAANDPAH